MINASPSWTLLTAKWSDFTIEKALRKDAFYDTFKARLQQNPQLNQEVEESAWGHPKPNRNSQPQNVFALKCLKKRSRSAEADRDARALKLEISILTQTLDHPNIIKVKGVSSGAHVSSSRFFCVLELVEETLADRLTKWRSKGKELEMDITSCSESRIKLVAIKLSGAMEHVHARGLSLGNLSPSTVGFDPMGNLKLIDFSEARFGYGASDDVMSKPPKLQQQQHASTSSSQLRYRSPESFVTGQTTLGRDEACGRQPGDVYSFAIILWEIMTLMVPYDFLDDQKTYSLSPLQRLMESRVGKRGVRPKLPGSLFPTRIVRQLLESSWDRDPLARPTFVRISLTLSDEFGPPPAEWDLGAKIDLDYNEFSGEHKNNRSRRSQLDDENSSAETDSMGASFTAETENVERV